jgi:hypothetical protein
MHTERICRDRFGSDVAWPCDRDVVAHAVNEWLDELAWHRRASYTRTLRESVREVRHSWR